MSPNYQGGLMYDNLPNDPVSNKSLKFIEEYTFG